MATTTATSLLPFNNNSGRANITQEDLLYDGRIENTSETDAATAGSSMIWDEEKQIQILQEMFIGPTAQNSSSALDMIREVLEETFQYRKDTTRKLERNVLNSTCTMFNNNGGVNISQLKPDPNEIENIRNKMKTNVRFILDRMKDEVPNFSTNFFSQMQSDTTILSLVGNVIGLTRNPNMCTNQMSRVSKDFEGETIVDISDMLGYSKGSSFGHFTADGTIANFESIVRARTRCYEWITMGCMAKKYNLALTEKEKKICSSMFGIGHMGWEMYDRISALFNEYLLETGQSKYELMEPYMLEVDMIEAVLNITELFEKKKRFQTPIMIVPSNKHYSWPKSHVFGIDHKQFWYANIDEKGRVDVNHLEELINKARDEDRPIFMLVSVFGSTECGNFDRLDQIVELLHNLKKRKDEHYYLHCDGAYGGFMLSTITSSRNDTSQQQEEYKSYMACAEHYLGKNLINSFRAIKHANSVTIDPHKLGFLSYACGAYIQKEEREYYYRKSDAPYISITGKERGTVTLEGSRAVGGALATWLTSKVMGFDFKGLGSIILHSIKTKQYLEDEMRKQLPSSYFMNGDTNVINFVIAKNGELVSATNKRTSKLFQFFSPENMDAEFLFSTTVFRNSPMVDHMVGQWNGQQQNDESCDGGLRVLRLVILNPFLNSKTIGWSHIPRLVSLLESKIRKELQ